MGCCVSRDNSKALHQVEDKKDTKLKEIKTTYENESPKNSTRRDQTASSNLEFPFTPDDTDEML